MSTDAIAEVASLPVSEESRPAGLSSPPDSNDALMLDGSDSELSDIEEPEEDIGEVVPDRYEGGVPIFTPTMEQFKSFTPFVSPTRNHYQFVLLTQSHPDEKDQPYRNENWHCQSHTS
jgi:hypothetical protein